MSKENKHKESVLKASESLLKLVVASDVLEAGHMRYWDYKVGIYAPLEEAGCNILGKQVFLINDGNAHRELVKFAEVNDGFISAGVKKAKYNRDKKDRWYVYLAVSYKPRHFGGDEE